MEEVGILLSIAPLIGFYFYLRKYRIFSGGWEGEKQVAKLLTNKLNDDYYILNDLSLHNGGGDIDHIVLGPKVSLFWKPKIGAAASLAAAMRGNELANAFFQKAQVDRLNGTLPKSNR